jgi:hypothetical protein
MIISMTSVGSACSCGVRSLLWISLVLMGAARTILEPMLKVIGRCAFRRMARGGSPSMSGESLPWWV